MLLYQMVLISISNLASFLRTATQGTMTSNSKYLHSSTETFSTICAVKVVRRASKDLCGGRTIYFNAESLKHL